MAVVEERCREKDTSAVFIQANSRFATGKRFRRARVAAVGA